MKQLLFGGAAVLLASMPLAATKIPPMLQKPAPIVEPTKPTKPKHHVHRQAPVFQQVQPVQRF